MMASLIRADCEHATDKSWSWCQKSTKLLISYLAVTTTIDIEVVYINVQVQTDFQKSGTML